MIELTQLEAIGYACTVFSAGAGAGFIFGSGLKTSTVEAKCSETVYANGLGFQVKYTKRYDGLFHTEILCEHINKKKICNLTKQRCKYI